MQTNPASSHTTNLGTTKLKRRQRSRDPMRDFDALPPPLRAWMTEAALPWSARSCLRIWVQARKRGDPPEAILARLSAAEKRQLSKDALIRERA